METRNMANNKCGSALYLTKKQLEEYRSLIKEATEERIRLRFLEKEASRSDGSNCPAAVAYRKDIKENLDKCVRAAGEIRKFIDGIEESKVRRIFAMYYIDGWSWQKIAYAIGTHCEATPRNLHNRYLARRFKEFE